MAVLKAGDVGRFSGNPDPNIRAFLIHGNDIGQVRELAGDLVIAQAGSSDDPFNVVRLDDAALKDDPARLADEAQAISMMGGKRAIWVRNAGTAFLSVVKVFLASPVGDSLIIAEAAALRKGQALRDLFEKARNAYSVACYEDGSRDLASIISEHFAKHSLNIGHEARFYLSQILGADRALSRSELDKLTTYCLGKSEVSLADVEAICGDAAALNMDDAIDAVFEGDPSSADRWFGRLVASGAHTQGIMTVATHHILRLQTLALEVSAGKSAKQSVDSARPPIFWKRKDSLQRQLHVWQLPALDGALSQLREAELSMRNLPALSESIASRTLLSIASRAKRERLKG